MHEGERLAVRMDGSRYCLTMVDDAVAMELLAAILLHRGITPPERPRLRRAVQAIRTAAAGTCYQVGQGITLEFTARKYRVTVV